MASRVDSSLCMNEEIAEIYNRQYHTVYRVCFSFMKNAGDAEDMVQETFLKLISSKKQFESQEHEKAWLIVTASNACKDELRWWKRRFESNELHFRQKGFLQEDARPKDFQYKTAKWVEHDEMRERVNNLPVKYKQVIYLYYYEGYRTSEIAAMLHCAESTVRNQLMRGRRLLQKNSVYRAKPGLILAAVLAGSLFVAVTTYAAYAYGLRDLHIGKEADVISLAGIAGSPEYMACHEWNAFLKEYDKDGALLSEIGNGFAGLGEYEFIYNCYTQEMADKVDELCEKYNLSRLEELYFAKDYAELCGRADIGDICPDREGEVRWDISDGYLYQDGTFHMEGSAIWKSSLLYVTDFQLMRTMKGSFNPVTLNVGAIEEYREWNYTTENGQNVLLAKSREKALIIVERDSSFIVVNVLGKLPSDEFAVSDEMLEELAEIFDFSEIP